MSDRKMLDDGWQEPEPMNLEKWLEDMSQQAHDFAHQLDASPTEIDLMRAHWLVLARQTFALAVLVDRMRGDS